MINIKMVTLISAYAVALSMCSPKDGAGLPEFVTLPVGQSHASVVVSFSHLLARFSCGSGSPSPFETSKVWIAAGHGTVCHLCGNVNGWTR